MKMTKRGQNPKKPAANVALWNQSVLEDQITMQHLGNKIGEDASVNISLVSTFQHPFVGHGTHMSNRLS